MEIPKPPPDQELKNIIDKLAQFVARNGQEFEHMTKNKQKDNPKFSFLFGGDFFNYYQYKVTTEQSILKHRQGREQGPMSPMMSHNSQYSNNQNFQNNQNFPNHNQNYHNNQNYPNPNNQNFPNQNNRNFHNHNNQNFNNQNFQNQNYQHDYNDYNYQSSNYNDQQYPPGPPDMQGQYNQQQYNMGRMQGDGMPMGSGPPNMGRGNFGGPNAPYHSNEPFIQSPNADRQYPPRHPNFPMQGNMNQNYPAQQPNMMQTNSDQGGCYGMGPGGPGPMQGPNNDHRMPSNNIPAGAPNDEPSLPAMTDDIDRKIEELKQEEKSLDEQIKQSEQNLTAQQLVLDQQRETQIQEGLHVARGEVLKKDASTLGIAVQGFDEVLQPICESCTKDSISNGKHFIFTHATSDQLNQWICSYLLYKATSQSSPFLHKLHIIYLMNDVLHHCVRKNAGTLKDSLERVLSPMYCHAYTTATDEQREKLNKLLTLWQNKMNLDKSLLDELRSPEETIGLFNENLSNEFSQVVATVNQHLSITFDGYKQQHNTFVDHASSQIQQIKQQLSQLQQEKIQIEQNNQQKQGGPQAPFMQMGMPPNQQFPPGGPSGPLQQNNMEYNQPPPGFGPPAQSGQFPVIDFSKPPPGFVDGKENLIPTVPYFELPAALMAPLVHISDNKFKPLDPAKLRLPLPTPPSERLLAAVENFYQPPSHDRPRNCDGWETIALFDYYKAKMGSIREKERMTMEGLRDASRSPSPVEIDHIPPDDPLINKGPVRRYRSVSPEVEEKVKDEKKDTPSRSKSPERRDTSPRDRDRRSSRSRSPSYSPKRRNSRSGSPMESRYRRRSRSMSPPPPSFGSIAPYSTLSSIDESNKGHQMLRSMGWGGAGLGANEQGIAAPIDAGDVRETNAEKFRGLGIPSAQSDPFEAFRKNKGMAFIHRMKQRAEERERESEYNSK